MLKINKRKHIAKKSYKEREFGDHEFLKPGHEPYFVCEIEVYTLLIQEVYTFFDYKRYIPFRGGV